MHIRQLCLRELRYQRVPAFTADIGLRWDRQTLDPGGYAPWSPRVGLRYLWRERTELRAGWARAYPIAEYRRAAGERTA